MTCSKGKAASFRKPGNTFGNRPIRPPLSPARQAARAGRLEPRNACRTPGRTLGRTLELLLELLDAPQKRRKCLWACQAGAPPELLPNAGPGSAVWGRLGHRRTAPSHATNINFVAAWGGACEHRVLSDPQDHRGRLCVAGPRVQLAEPVAGPKRPR